MERRKASGLLVLALLLALVWFRPLDMLAEQYTESGLKRAFATVLDPLSDLVEQFSTVMLPARMFSAPIGGVAGAALAVSNPRAREGRH